MSFDQARMRAPPFVQGGVPEDSGFGRTGVRPCLHRLMNQQALSSFIWSVADLLREDYKQSEYGRVILPFTVLRRLDCVTRG
jgi:trans-aconitate methyltransferase